MTSKKQSGESPPASVRAVNDCLKGLRRGKLSSRHIRDLLGCDSCPEMDSFEFYLTNKDPLIRGQISKVIAKRSPEKVVEAILTETDVSAINMMIEGLEISECKDLDNLTPLLKHSNGTLVERVFELFVNVGRADLLFSLAVGGDELTTERVRRYLHEQGWLE